MNTHSRTMVLRNGSIVVSMLLIYLTTIAVYYKGLSGPFLLDDILSVASLNVDNLTFRSLKDIIFSDTTGPIGRPLTIATFAVNKLYSQPGSAYAFKAVNLGLHLTCSTLVFIFLRSVFQHLHKGNSGNLLPEANVVALLCTAAWTLHPIQVSTVLYVVQRMAILSTLFTLLTLIAYTQFRGDHSTKGRLSGYGFLIIFFIGLAILSKENGVLIIPMLALLELCIFRFRTIDGTKMISYKRFFIASAILTVPVVMIGAYHIWDSAMLGYTSRNYGLFERLISQPGALLFYLKQIFFPSLSDMSLYHDGFPVPKGVDINVLVNIVIITCIAIGGLISLRRFPTLTFGIGLFYTAHLLESTILPLEPVFEHRNYLALLGALIPVFWYGAIFIKTFIQRTSLARVAPLIAIIPMLFFSSLTFVRAFEWSDETILVNQAINEKPRSVRARNIYIGQLELSDGSEKVIEQLKKNQLDMPDRTHFVIQELMFTGIVSGLDKEVLHRSQDSLSKNPLFSDDIAALHDLLRHALEPKGQWMPIQHIKLLFQSAINNPVKHLKPSSQAILLEQYAIVLRVLKDYDDALKAVEKAISMDNTYIQSRLTKAYLLADKGEFQQSQIELDAVQILDRRNKYQEPITVLQNILSRITQAENVQ